ncbi:MAG TPA: 7TM-DISM domain-containing protein [Polyangiales bacterium]
MRQLLVCALLWLLALPGAAQPVIDVARELRGVSMQQHVDWLEDPTTQLEVEQVVSSPEFHSNPDKPLNFGFSKSAYWLRFKLGNPGHAARGVMLEVAHPQLDYVTLYVPSGGGGFDVRRTGDQLPFAQRDLAYRNFVFTLEQPPGEDQTYYLRVESEGLLELPLKLWTVEQFVEHQHHDWAVLCVYYGILLVLAAYAFAMFLFTRELPNLQSSFLIVATGLFQLAVVGHATQYLFADSRWLAQVAVPVGMGLISLTGTWFGKHTLLMVNPKRPRFAITNTFIGVSWALIACSLVLPVRQSLVLHILCDPPMFLIAMGMIVSEIRRGVREAWVVLLAYICVLIGITIAILKNAGVLPAIFITDWAYQISVSLQFLILGSAASMRLRVLRAQLATVNEELLHKVEQLEEAVVRAERATRLTEWATRVKDEFMATMSHELRTPLNTIINIPQGLVEEFVGEEQAVCAHCASVFALDAGEHVSTDTACMTCGQVGTLSERQRVRFVGDATRAVRYLEKIERSGMHLLGVINGMLQADKGESGRIDLHREWVDVRKLVGDVVDDMSDLAERAGVALSLDAAPGELELHADPLRVRQVLINLIGNAIKFSNGQGTVKVRLDAHERSCSIAVQDEGIGIAPDALENVFGSYQQAEAARAFGGTGLGLSISRSLVRAHGGELTVQSELGRGSTFTVTIPRRYREQKSA